MTVMFAFMRSLICRYKLRLALMILCFAYCFLCLIGLGWAESSISQSRTDFETSCGVGDLVVCSDTVARGELAATLMRIDGVAQVQEGIRSDTIRCKSTDGSVCSLRYYAFYDDGIVTPVLSDEAQVYISYAYYTEFAEEAPVHLTLPDGRQLTLSEWASMPAFTGVYADFYIPSTDGDVIDAWTTPERLAQDTGCTGVNYAVVTVRDDVAADAVIDQILTQQDVFVTYAAENEPAYAASLSLQAVIERLCGLFSWVVLAFGLVFVCVFLSGVCIRCLDSVVSLRAEGASLAAIFGGILGFASFALVIGFLCAVPLGAVLADFVARSALKNMGISYNGLALQMRTPLRAMAFGFVGIVAASLVAMLSVSGRWMQALRTQRRFRRKPYLLAPLGTAASVVLILLSLMFMDSLDRIREEQFSDRYGYDVQIVYDDMVPLKQLEDLSASGLTQYCDPMLFGTMELSFADNACDVTAVGLSDNPLLTVRSEDGTVLTPVDNAIILSEHTAAALCAQKGDLLRGTIRRGGTELTLLCTVADISAQSTAFVEVASVRTVEAYLNSSGVMNAAAVRVKSGCLEEFAAYAQTLDDICAVQTGRAGQTRFDQRYSAVRFLIGIVIAVSILLGLCVSLLMCWMQWKEEIDSVAVLYMLGRSPVRLVLESSAKRLPGLLFGLLVGIFAARALAPGMHAYLSTESVCYPVVTSADTLVFTALICIVFELGCIFAYSACCYRRLRTQK